MNRIKKLLAALLVVVMILAVLPAASFASEIAYQAAEAKKLAMLDDVWAPMEAVENEMLSKKATAAETAAAVYQVVLKDSRVDEGSLVWESDEQFAFTVDGMHNVYCYRVRNTKHVSAITQELLDIITEPSKGPNCGCAGSKNVLLVGPNYSEDLNTPGYYDSSFTAQYMNEARSIATATGGVCTILGGHNATGPAIAQNYTDKGVVIYDSHGIQSGTSSYLCLTTNTGITTTDYNNGWAVKSGSEAFIDGRYIQNHVSGTLSNCFVWMAICEGMKKEGKGTTGTALLAAGAAGVYGYSQSVTFTGDYKYEATFWTQMKNGATVKDAIAAMKSTWGNWDPAYSSSSGSAWPIVMSAVDAFPSNPDGAQTVNCDWELFGEPVAIDSISITPNPLNLTIGQSETITLNYAPDGNYNCSVVWSSENADVAAVSGNKATAVVTGRARGVITVTATVTDHISGNVLTADVTVNIGNGGAPDHFEPTDAVETDVEYLIGYRNGNDVYLLMNYNPNPVGTNNYYYNSSNNKYAFGVKAVVDAAGNVTGVDTSVYSGAALDHAKWKFENNGNYYKIASVYKENYYLRIRTSNTYSDLYPASGDTYATNWLWDASGKILSYYYSSTVTKYVSYVDSVGSASNVFKAGSSAESTSSLQLYKAVSVNEGFTVTFKDWDGTVIKTEEVALGGAATPPADPTRTGYDFIGWEGDYTNVHYDVTVTAVYSVKTFTVTFKDWDGTVLKTQTVDYGASATAPANPTRPGYTFAGWSGSYSNVTSNIVVTAIYMVNSYTLTINYVDSNGNQMAPSYTHNYNCGASYSVTSPVIEGYTANPAVVSGTMGAEDLTINVVYTEAGEQPVVTLLGDVNGDGVIDFSDASALAAYLMGGNEPAGLANADANGDHTVSIADITAIYAIIFG